MEQKEQVPTTPTQVPAHAIAAGCQNSPGGYHCQGKQVIEGRKENVYVFEVIKFLRFMRKV